MDCKGCGKIKINKLFKNNIFKERKIFEEKKLPISNYNNNETNNNETNNNETNNNNKFNLLNNRKKRDTKKDVRLTSYALPDDGLCFLDWYQSISINNFNSLFLNFDLWSPNFFRYYPVNSYSSYDDYFLNDPSQCPLAQVYTGNIKFFNLVTIFDKLLPLKTDKINIINQKNNDRNIFFSFILSLERAYFKFKEGKKYCKNQKVPWQGYFALNLLELDITGSVSYFDAANFPLTQEQQAGFYEIIMNRIDFEKDLSNAPSIFKQCADFKTNLNKIDYNMNFYKIVKVGYSLLETLVFYSEQVIKGKNTGIPCNFEKELFPIEFCYYYYNLYYNIVKQRSELFGFKNYFTNGSYNFNDPRRI